MKYDDLEVNYSPNVDILTADDTDREYERSVTAGNFIIDLDPEGKIRGIEIMSISNILGIKKDQLKNVSDAELEMTSHEEGMQVTLRFEIEDESTTLAAQLQPDGSKA